MCVLPVGLSLMSCDSAGRAVRPQGHTSEEDMNRYVAEDIPANVSAIFSTLGSLVVNEKPVQKQ
jgi:hypothetical protein